MYVIENMCASRFDGEGAALVRETGAHLVPGYRYSQTRWDGETSTASAAARGVVSRTSVQLMLGGNSVVGVVFSACTYRTLFGHYVSWCGNTDFEYHALNRDEDVTAILVPAKVLDEQMFLLFRYNSQFTALLPNLRLYKSIYTWILLSFTRCAALGSLSRRCRLNTKSNTRSSRHPDRPLGRRLRG